MKRRVLVILSSILLMFSCVMTPLPAYAAKKSDTKKSDDTSESKDVSDCGGSVLGLRPWYYGLCKGSGKDTEIVSPGKKDGDLAKFIWQIALNILFDLSLVIGYLALAMIVYGGYQYISSQGDPGKMAKGKKTLMASVIGTTVALSASVVIHTASTVLGADLFSGEISQNLVEKDVIQNILNYAYSMAGLVAVAFIIKGGFDYIFSQGDPGKTAQGTRTLIGAIIGLVIVIMARVITALILRTTGGAL